VEIINEHRWAVVTAAGEFRTEPLTPHEFHTRLDENAVYAVRRDHKSPTFYLLSKHVIAYRDLPNGT